ncbi:MAG: DNA polymerase III subunit gamma/tau [Flavobacteriales bacterium]
MENFIVSARKYRPKEFSDVVGQRSITNTLVQSIENNHLAQALLFCGPRGVGKTTCARILARKINEEINATGDEDYAFNIFELDAASNNSVDDIRSLIEQVRFAPQQGKYKVYIIDEVHMLSQAAFNAFLKTLEEPPPHAIFILATTEKHKIIPTILSRCQIYDFKRISVLDIKNHLKTICEDQNVIAEDDALHLIAQKADGALRDALSTFDRVVSFSGKNDLTVENVSENLNILDYDAYFKIIALALENKLQEILLSYDSIVNKGFDGHLFISGLASHCRDLLMAQNAQTLSLLEVGEKTQQKYLIQAQKTTTSFLMNALEICSQADTAYRASKNQRLTIEIALMQLASLTAEENYVKKKDLT